MDATAGGSRKMAMPEWSDDGLGGAYEDEEPIGDRCGLCRGVRGSAAWRVGVGTRLGDRERGDGLAGGHSFELSRPSMAAG